MASRVLVCNLTRFGDLLQTQPLISSLAASGHSVSLLCLDAFAAAPALMSNLENVFSLPMAEIAELEQKHWQTAANHLLEFASATARGSKADLLVNLTPSVPARLLTRLLTRGNSSFLGFGMDQNGYAQNIGTWASFLSMGARERHFAPFNLSDIFRKIGGNLASEFAGQPSLAMPDAQLMEWAKDFAAARLSTKARPNGFIAFQLGASENRRRWPLEHFQRLGSILWEKASLAPILLGSPAEIPLAQTYTTGAQHPFVNAIGETSLPQLAALLLQCRLLVTNDTGTMHLAAGLGVRSLAFFLATAQPWDTGPALTDCCCLEPNLPCHPCAFGSYCTSNESCRALISPETAANLALSWLEKGDWQAGVTPQACRESRVWRSARDSSSLLTLEPLSGQENQPQIQWLLTLREFWRQLLDGLDQHPSQATYGQHSRTPANEETIKALKRSIELLNFLIKTAPQLQTNRQAGKIFLQTCQQIQNLLQFSPPLASLGAFWREFQLNQGGDLGFFLKSLKTFRNSFTELLKHLGPAAD